MANERRSPGTGRNTGVGSNSGLASHDEIRKALAVDVLYEQLKAALNEKHKLARERYKGRGVTVEQLKDLKAMTGLTSSQIEAKLRGGWHYLCAIFQPLGEQFDFLQPKTLEGPKKAASFTMGMLAGIEGKDLVVPPAVVGEELQEITAGYQEGSAMRRAAEEMAKEIDDEAAGKPKSAGKVTSTAPETAKSVGAKAAADFAKDNGGVNPLVFRGETYKTLRAAAAAKAAWEKDHPGKDPNAVEGAPVPEQQQPDAPAPVETVAEPDAESQPGDGKTQQPHPAALGIPMPDFTGFDDDPNEWSTAQHAQFNRWFENLTLDAQPLIVHAGAAKRFRMARTAQVTAMNVAAKAEGPKPQTAETPDAPTPAEVAAAAKKLGAPPKRSTLPKPGRTDTRGSKG